jgi:putative transposase
VLAGEHTRHLNRVSAKVCSDSGAVLDDCNGQDDHVHLLTGYPPQVSAVAALVNSLKGVSARMPRQRYRIRSHRGHLWSPSYFAASCRGARRCLSSGNALSSSGHRAANPV